MKKMLALLLVVSVVSPGPVFAQSLLQPASMDDARFTAVALTPGPLMTAALHEASLAAELSRTAHVDVQATSQAPLASLNQVQSIPIGSRVRVTLLSGVRIEGRLVEKGPDAVILNENRLLSRPESGRSIPALGGNQTFMLTDVVSIVRTPDNWFRKHPGLAAGLIAGGVVGTIVLVSAANGFGAY